MTVWWWEISTGLCVFPFIGVLVACEKEQHARSSLPPEISLSFLLALVSYIQILWVSSPGILKRVLLSLEPTSFGDCLSKWGEHLKVVFYTWKSFWSVGCPWWGCVNRLLTKTSIWSAILNQHSLVQELYVFCMHPRTIHGMQASLSSGITATQDNNLLVVI